MHLLTRFFSQKNFLDAFISGKLYMNTLNYFWNNGFEEQKDIFEKHLSDKTANETSKAALFQQTDGEASGISIK